MQTALPEPGSASSSTNATIRCSSSTFLLYLPFQCKLSARFSTTYVGGGRIDNVGHPIGFSPCIIQHSHLSTMQVTTCETSKEAIKTLKAQKRQDGGTGFDLILKDHCPTAGTNACRLLRKAKSEPVLQDIPIIGRHSTRNSCFSHHALGLRADMTVCLRITNVLSIWSAKSEAFVNGVISFCSCVKHRG